MTDKKILIIGEVFVDTHLDTVNNSDPVVRLGGIFHAARACSSVKSPFYLAYYAPKYLDSDIHYYASTLNAIGVLKLGTVNKSPNVMLINESKEICDQGYVNILKDQIQIIEENNLLNLVAKLLPSDIIIFPGRYNTSNILKQLNNYNGKIHIDYNYDSRGILEGFTNTIATLSISSSSELFESKKDVNQHYIRKYFSNYKIAAILIKENRGGSCCYSFIDKILYECGCYFVPTAHSVGVGDCYLAVFVSFLHEGIGKSIRIASLLSSLYAKTFDFNIFEKSVNDILSKIDEYLSLKGIRLSSSDKMKHSIYIAAPDFPNVDTSLLKQLNISLIYHGFNPHFPIQENGLLKSGATEQKEHSIYAKDRKLLERCDLMIAVLLYADPGTLVEIGIFKQMGKKVILLDPNNISSNMFLRYTADAICRTIEGTLDETYKILGKPL